MKIPPEKIEALRQALERDGEVAFFKNGSTIEREVKQGGIEGEKVEARLLVTRPAGGVARYAETELARAYDMALNGPAPIEQPPPSNHDFGEDAPF